MQKLLCLACAFMFLCILPCNELVAAENVMNEVVNVVEMQGSIYALEREMGIVPFGIVDADIGMSFANGKIKVMFVTSVFPGTPSVVGVKDIKLQQKEWLSWKTVGTYPGGGLTNCTTMGVSCVYENPIAGETYRVSGIHYTVIDDCYSEIINVTSGYVYGEDLQ